MRSALLALLLLGLLAPAARGDLAAEVDPMVGTFPPGFTFPGAAVPFGMVQNSPDTEGEFAYSGYLYTDATIRGFSLVHLSGPGVRKAGDLRFMPTVGPASEDPAVYAAPFSHAGERAEPGSYAVQAGAVRVELTASRRAAMQRYTFPPGSDAKVIVDLAHSVETAAPKETSWAQTGPNEITGHRRGRYPVYFVARFDRPFKSAQAFASGGGGWVGFDTTAERTVTARIGVSFVDAAGARRNLEAEAPEERSFGAMRAAARAAWNRELGRIRIGGGGALERRAFYTALYHAFLHPNVFEDVDGRYRGADDRIHQSGPRTHYANFSSWDTYKAQNQLLAITQPRRYEDMLRSLLAVYEQAGRLPRWGEQSIDAAHMSGDPVIPMIAEATCRGLLVRSEQRALYMAAVALRDHRPAELDRLGYLPDRPGTTLEYGVADFALALMAEALGERDDAARWLQASLNYRNVLDPETKWIRPRGADGAWHAPFDPALDETGFQEGNAWQYSWLAPHDARGLIDRMGGDAAVHERWDTFFALPAQVQSHLTLMGTVYRLPQYAPGNEHDIQAPWMPVFAGRPWQVADVHRDVRALFRPTVDGLPGNDDLGSLSAWHVLSALGFGPVTPGAPFMVIGSPQFESATIALGRRRAFRVSAPGAALQPYVQAARLDGRPLPRAWFDDRDLRDGGRLDLTMGARPGAWATAPEAAPPSATGSNLSAFGCRSGP